MPVGGVVRHEIQEQLDPTRVERIDQRVEVGKPAEDRIDVLEVLDVVAEVAHRRGMDRRQPHRGHAQLREMAQACHDSGQVAQPVAVRVLQNQDAILALLLGRADRIGVRFGDPEAAAIVERERNRPHDVRLGRRELHREALRNGHGLCRRFPRQAGVLHRVHRRQHVHVLGNCFIREERPRPRWLPCPSRHGSTARRRPPPDLQPPRSPSCRHTRYRRPDRTKAT